MAQSSSKYDHIYIDIGDEITINPQPIKTATTSEGIVWNVQDSIVTFKGREDIIQQLHQRIEVNQINWNRNVVSQTTAICGMEGLGKTETVRKYIQIYHSNYTNIVWINAENYSEAKTCFMHLAERINISTTQAVSTLKKWTAEEDRHLADRIYAHLVKDRTLIVFDNVQLLSHDAIKSSFFPATTLDTKTPDVILTTREQLSDYHTIHLRGLSLEETYELLVSSLAINKTDENYTAAQDIYTLSEGLPIALQQVIGVIRKENEDKMRTTNNKYSLAEYATSVHANLHRLTTAKPAESPLGDSVFAIFQISFERMIALEHGKLALHCLDIMSLLNPDNIPSTLLRIMINDNSFTSAMSLLVDYNLVTLDEHEDMFGVHRMIQAIRRYSTNFLKMRDSTLKRFSAWISGRSLISAELYAFKHFLNKIELSDKNIFHVLHNGIRLHDTFHVHKPSEFFEQRGFLYALAEKLKLVGRYDEAQQIYHVLLAEWMKAMGESLPHTVDTTTKLYIVYTQQKNYEKAEEMIQCMLQERTKLLGESHPDTLFTKYMLAKVYIFQENYEKAEEIFQFELQDLKKVFGKSHRDTLILKNNIGHVYILKKKYDQAEESFQFVLQERTKLLDENHLTLY